MRRGDWMKLNCGDRVHDVADPRHVGRVEAVVNAATVKVRWENGWLSYLPIENIERGAMTDSPINLEEADELAIMKAETSNLARAYIAVRSENERLRAGQLAKRPVMFRVMDDNIWRVFSDEKEAQEFADKIGVKDYQGLYVRDGR